MGLNLCGLDSPGSGYGSVACFYEKENELSIKGEELAEKRNSYQLLKRGCAPLGLVRFAC